MVNPRYVSGVSRTNAPATPPDVIACTLPQARVGYARRGQYIHASGPSPHECERAGVGGRSGGHDIINQQYPSSDEGGSSRWAHDKGASDFTCALACRLVPQVGGRACPYQRIGQHPFVRAPRQSMAEQRRLVVASHKQSSTMQGHRYQHISLAQQCTASAGHLTHQQRRHLDTIGIFQRKQQAASLCVVSQCRARPVECRRRRSTGWAQEVDAALGQADERYAAPDAARFGDEAGLSEAVRAEFTQRQYRLATGEAVRRQRQVESRAPSRACPIGQAVQEVRRRGTTRPRRTGLFRRV